MSISFNVFSSFSSIMLNWIMSGINVALLLQYNLTGSLQSYPSSFSGIFNHNNSHIQWVMACNSALH
jgi:hypothetical protein